MTDFWLLQNRFSEMHKERLQIDKSNYCISSCQNLSAYLHVSMDNVAGNDAPLHSTLQTRIVRHQSDHCIKNILSYIVLPFPYPIKLTLRRLPVYL